MKQHAMGLSGPNELDVCTLNTITNEWHLVTDKIEVDTVNKHVLVYVSHFSIYRLGYDLPLCFSDFESDGDQDGLDLWNYINRGKFAGIAGFAASFGRTNCP